MTLSQLNELKYFEKEASERGLFLTDYLYDCQERIEAHIILLKREGVKETEINSYRDELIKIQELILTMTSGDWIYSIDESKLN